MPIRTGYTIVLVDPNNVTNVLFPRFAPAGGAGAGFYLAAGSLFCGDGGSGRACLCSGDARRRQCGPRVGFGYARVSVFFRVRACMYGVMSCRAMAHRAYACRYAYALSPVAALRIVRFEVERTDNGHEVWRWRPSMVLAAICVVVRRLRGVVWQAEALHISSSSSADLNVPARTLPRILILLGEWKWWT
ncbi:hypothetical protein C8R45DRAFT_1008305 [Mycena sanguinolenta]|nr:hypothetical protein C8R45DRAFT_1008305 [Mycena sanguinolenta]